MDLRMTVKESEKIDKYLNLIRDLKNSVEYEGNSDTNWSWYSWNGPQSLEKRWE